MRLRGGIVGLLWPFFACANDYGENSLSPDAGVSPEGGGASTICGAGGHFCRGSELHSCAPNGQASTTIEVCTNNLLCVAGIPTGKCAAPICAAGEVLCVGGERHQCREDRASTQHLESCAGATPVCAGGACVECVDGTRDCAGEAPRACVKGKWESQPVCSTATNQTCWVGTCVDARLVHWEMPNDSTSAVRPIRYTILSNDIVRDEVTKLEWQRGLSPAPVDIQGGARIAYCRSLVLDGKNDFHLPSTVELLSLLDYGKAANEQKIDSVAFPNTPASGLVASETASPRRMNYVSGLLEAESTAGGAYYTRCVRAVVAAPAEPRFTVIGEEVVDNWTKLTWKKGQSGYFTDGNPLLNYCQAPFRLPTIKELYTIYDPRPVPPLPHIDTTVFSMDTDFLWSSNLKVGAVDRLRLNFETNFGTIEPGADSRARCVK